MARQYPGEPVESCPDLDDAISGIEKARSIAVDLRIWGREQYDRAESLEEERDRLIEEVKYLEQEVSDAVLETTRESEERNEAS